MQLNLQPIAVPLREHAPGAYRLNGTRVSLDLVIDEFKAGRTPEAIVHAYDTLSLADVYAVITYYLANRAEVEAYLRVRDQEAERLRLEAEASQPSREALRAKLLAREGHPHAPAGK
jgi:uncharacterized protein (DUF433 family)